MFARKQRKSLYACIPQHGLSISDFTYDDDTTDTITYTHSSGYYFKVYIGHERVSKKGVEQLITVEWTPFRSGVVLNQDKSQLRQMIEDWSQVVYSFDEWLMFLAEEYDIDTEARAIDTEERAEEPNRDSQLGFHPLASMHGLVHHSAGKLFVDGHYPQAILAACTALDKVLQQHTGQPAELTGTALMNKVFSPDNPLIRLSPVKAEQQGYLLLFNGLTQAIRNHYAHNLTELSNVNRALEWLGFISALCYQIGNSAGEAQSASSNPTP
jgi:uncharacterized protein (TIGR02391 family)